MDFDFSPFNENLLATASDDGKIKFWLIPDEGITKHTTESDAELNGHSKKVVHAKFHPSSDYTMVSSGADTTVRIWDISAQANVHTFEDVKSINTGLEWSTNGSLIGCIAKDKTVNIFDPRRQGSALVGEKTHEGTKPQKLVWFGDNQTLMTVGFTKMNEREYGIWDCRDFSKPLLRKRLDDYTGVPVLHFDEDSGVLFIAGKGESAVSFFQYNSASPNVIDYVTGYKGKEPQKSVSFMPKRYLDLMSCEVARGVRITSQQLEYI